MTIGGPAGRPALGAGLGVLAVPAKVGAGVPAIGHQQAERKFEPAQRAPRDLQAAAAAAVLRRRS